MPKALDFFLKPISDGLYVMAEKFQGMLDTSAGHIRSFASSPLDFVQKHPFATLFGVLGAAQGVGLGAALLGGVVGGAIVAPISIPIGISLMAMKVSGFVGIVYGGLETIRSAGEMYHESYRNITAVEYKKKFKSIGTYTKNMTPNWMRKCFKKGFNTSAKRADNDAQAPIQKPALKPTSHPKL